MSLIPLDKKILKNTIFIVDDDEGIVNSLSSFFEIKGFKTRMFSSASAYLDALDNTPGILISDINMPKMSGIELLEALRKKRHFRPMLFITGFATIELAVKTVQLGACDFIEKPFSTRTLLDKIIRIFEKTESNAQANLQYQSLTKRERQVFELVIKDLTNIDIAEKLFITVSTVEKHRAVMMRKMDVKTLTELIKKISKLDFLGSQ
ncbi:response regulator transcription factor [Candidatus Woesearchaeota archaeon]|mgnify:FL=1|nr:response regulator transcription factor [Candidatus Woesearchaeota archaeon]